MFRTLTPILSIITAVVLFLTLAQPQYTEIKNIKNEINDYRTATEQYTAFEEKVDNLRKKKEGINVSDVERLEMLVPETYDNTRIIVDLENLTRKNNMLFGNIEASDKTDLVAISLGGGTSEMDELVASEVSFDVIGTYDQFKNLLRDLESSLTLMDVTSVKFSSSESKFQQFSITVRTYALSEGSNEGTN